MQCHQFREVADSYLGNELSVETIHDINTHLEHCSSCRAELESRRALRGTLRQAFIGSPENQVRPEFVARLGTKLQIQASHSGQHYRGTSNNRLRSKSSLIAIAACLLVVTLAGLQMMRLWSKRQSISQGIANSSPNDLANSVKTELLKSAVGDHKDCAVHFRLAEKPLDLDRAGQQFDRVYVNLVPALISQGNLPPGLEFVESHSCVFEGRRFAHMVFKYQNRLVSLLITRNGATDATSSAAVHQQVISCSQFEGYRVSCFQTARHAVFVVSDLTEGENLSLARALSPAIDAHVTRAEQGT